MEESLVTADATILDAGKTDYMLLSAPGNIGFYKRAAFVEVFLFAKATKRVIPVYTLVVFEEALPEKASPAYNRSLYSINDAFSLGVRTYDMTTDDAEKVFLELLLTNRWTAHNDGRRTPTPLKALRRQFVPPIGNYRTNALLKNNFFGGSHLIEFFDELKREMAFLTAGDGRHLLEKLSREVQDRTQLNLAINPDRLGNVVFQFPATVMDLRVQMEEKGMQYRLALRTHLR